jgi:hypothetical protein
MWSGGRVRVQKKGEEECLEGDTKRRKGKYEQEKKILYIFKGIKRGCERAGWRGEYDADGMQMGCQYRVQMEIHICIFAVMWGSTKFC